VFEPGVFVHESSYVDAGAHIGSGTKIWHFCHIMSGARLGAHCNLGQNVFVASRVIVGDNVKIQNNVSLYDGVTLEADVFVGPSVVFTNVRHPRSHVDRKSEYAMTRVKRGASIGANATIVCGVTLGSYSFVGAGAVVTADVPDYALVYGNPARVHGWVCECGEKLDLGPEDWQEYCMCHRCDRVYHVTIPAGQRAPAGVSPMESSRVRQ